MPGLPPRQVPLPLLHFLPGVLHLPRHLRLRYLPLLPVHLLLPQPARLPQRGSLPVLRCVRAVRVLSGVVLLREEAGPEGLGR